MYPFYIFIKEYKKFMDTSFDPKEITTTFVFASLNMLSTCSSKHYLGSLKLFHFTFYQCLQHVRVKGVRQSV